MNILHNLGDLSRKFWVNAKAARSSQSLTTHFQQDTFVSNIRHGNHTLYDDGRLPCAPGSKAAGRPHQY
jgi:hypothetical protein